MSGVLVKEPDNAAAITAADLYDNAMKAVAAAEVFECNGPDDEKLLADARERLRQGAKYLEGQRNTVTKPLRDALEGVRNWFAGPLERIAKADAKLVASWRGYRARVEAEERDRRLALERAAAAERERMKAESAASATPAPPSPPAALARPVAPAGPVRGAVGRMAVVKTIQLVEVTDWSEVAANAPALLSVSARDAAALYRSARDAGTLDPANPWLLYGMRFREVETPSRI